MSITTHTPSEASSVSVAPVARTLSMEADWISVATVPMLTVFTCARRATKISIMKIKFLIQGYLTPYNTCLKPFIFTYICLYNEQYTLHVNAKVFIEKENWLNPKKHCL